MPFAYSPLHSGATPTPSEFVQYLVMEEASSGVSHFDSHFKPQWFTGHFCEADYDYIGRMETFDQDVETIRTKLKIPEVR